MHSSQPKFNRRKARQSASVSPQGSNHLTTGRGPRGAGKSHQAPFVPPETWYEPGRVVEGEFDVVRQTPGQGYDHVVNERDVRRRLAQLPQELLGPLEVVQLSRMTRKKRNAPCYGMQWGATLYLYPLECSLIEPFDRPPRPAVRIETEMYGGRWRQHGSTWTLHWTADTIRDYYLNNVLIHELGHLLDTRNSSYLDRERYAEWFAIEYGYKPSRAKGLGRKPQTRKKRVVRRHARV